MDNKRSISNVENVEESPSKKARVDNEALPVPIVYQEGEEVLGVSLWFPGRVDEATRTIIFAGLRGDNSSAWAEFLHLGNDDEYASNMDLVLPKELSGLRPKDLGVVDCEDDRSFCFKISE